MAKILLVDDHEVFCLTFSEMIRRLGHDCDTSLSLGEAEKAIGRTCYDMVFLDVSLPDGNGLDFIAQVLNTECKPEVTVLTANGDKGSAERALRAGAWDYLLKPIRFRELQVLLERTLRLRDSKKSLRNDKQFERSSIVGNSPQLEKCLDQVAIAAQGGGNILITGETGTGKELFARAIHQNSARAGREFIVVDCTNLPRTLAESLLFGHEKGSFTGAQEAREGLFKQADGGTIFLDEIGDLDLDIQKSLLRVLQEKKFRPLSSKREISSDFRLIAATNRDLEEMVRQGRFRSDLYYRLRTHVIKLPALRERAGDIPLLIDYYVEKTCANQSIPAKKASQDFLDVLLRYDWPGNVRELANVVYSSVHNAIYDDVLNPYHFPIEIRMFVAAGKIEASDDAAPRERAREKAPLAVYAPGSCQLQKLRDVRKVTINSMEEMYLKELVGICGSSVRKACKMSGLSRARLYELLQKHNISLKGR
ncbi:putative two component, sigma54 specific, transcriptional regulator [Desulfovibrio sp. X2]|uniref:sigma-54-dependent transcriptional regulator n=1 Tax=Desulfovibrio sp. X2 TaxID=941449 RepID=UPI00035899DF|nr:sigma-54 dependent transcriptional regulator [Desulfovibrio sp. X2]EPR37219.1 putative two component, sigma54 specific, transcriptional regulator [Desulfovibrio sp. X2]